MKLVFKKDERNQIVVHQLVDDQEIDFSYVDMIKALIKSGRMEQPDVGEGFSEAEKKSIASMIEFINSKVSEIIEPVDQAQVSE